MAYILRRKRPTSTKLSPEFAVRAFSGILNLWPPTTIVSLRGYVVKFTNVLARHVLKILTLEVTSTCFQIEKKDVSKILGTLTALLSLSDFWVWTNCKLFQYFFDKYPAWYDTIRHIDLLDQCNWNRVELITQCTQHYSFLSFFPRAPISMWKFHGLNGNGRRYNNYLFLNFFSAESSFTS